MTKESGKNTIKSAWRTAGITEALESGINGLPSLDPFQEIDPLLETSNEENQPNLSSITSLTEEQLKIAYTPIEDEESDEESEWEIDHEAELDVDFSRSAFDSFEL